MLVGIYLVQMIVRGAYRPPREFLFWTVLLMGLATLGLNLTGDLLAWDQNSFWATSIRIAYLSHLPVIGPWLCKLAIGGPQFGTLTITRFLALHVGACTAALLALILFHAHLASRHGLEAGDRPVSTTRCAGAPERGRGEASAIGVPYWPQQAWRDAAACCIVHGGRRGAVGKPRRFRLRRPASSWAPRPIRSTIPARRGPNGRSAASTNFTKRSADWPEMVSIFVIPGLTVLLFFAMPWIGTEPGRAGVNIALALLVFGGLGVLAWQSYADDAGMRSIRPRWKKAAAWPERVKELAQSPQKIPVSGALTLLRTDAKTQGPRLFNQHCASCHDYSGEALVGITRPEKPTATDLYGFASREWLTEFLQVQGHFQFQVLRQHEVQAEEDVRVHQGHIQPTYQPREKQQVIEALSHEAAVEVAERGRRPTTRRTLPPGTASSRTTAPIAIPSTARARRRAPT